VRSLRREAVSQSHLGGETGVHLWARVTGMSLNRRYPFESTKITVASFPLNLTFSPREKEIITSSDTYETGSRGRDEGYWLVPITHIPRPEGTRPPARERGLAC